MFEVHKSDKKMAPQGKADQISNDNDNAEEVSDIRQVLRRRQFGLSPGYDRYFLRQRVADVNAHVSALKSDFIRQKTAYQADRENQADIFAFHLNLFFIAIDSLQQKLAAYDHKVYTCICDNAMPECDLQCDPIRKVNLIFRQVRELIRDIWSTDLQERVERQRKREIRQLMEGLPTIIIAEDHRNEIHSCRVCFSDFEEAELACHLPCNEQHIVHRECIQQWLKRQNVCPVCTWPAFGWTFWMEPVGDGEISTLRFSFEP